MVRFLLSIIVISSFFLGSLAKEPPPAPTKMQWVQDEVGLLSSEQQMYLQQKLKTYADSTSNEIAVVIEKSLQGDDVFDYTVRLAEKWGIGNEKKDNGVLIYIAYENNDPNKRKIWIQVGRGLEGAITDVHSKRIIERMMAPSFKEERYGEGINKAIDGIIALAAGEYVNDAEESEKKFPIGLVIVLIIVLFMILSKNNNNSKSFGRGSTGPIWLGGGGSSWGGGGGFGGGGSFGGGFGGGSFGGGGAGGSW